MERWQRWGGGGMGSGIVGVWVYTVGIWLWFTEERCVQGLVNSDALTGWDMRTHIDE